MARSALLTHTTINYGSGVSLKASLIFIYDREAPCGYLEEKPPGDERMVEIRVQGEWPPPPHSIRTTDDPAVDGSDPYRDRVYLAAFNWGRASAYALGTVEIIRASRTDGLLSIDLVTRDPDRPASGSVRGTIPLIVCD